MSRDQGFASSFWLGLLFAFTLRFVLRWKKEYHLDYPEQQLWLVIARRKGGLPWYLPDLRADHLR
jgi:hypothetical protein